MYWYQLIAWPYLDGHNPRDTNQTDLTSNWKGCFLWTFNVWLDLSSPLQPCFSNFIKSIIQKQGANGFLYVQHQHLQVKYLADALGVYIRITVSNCIFWLNMELCPIIYCVADTDCLKVIIYSCYFN